VVTVDLECGLDDVKCGDAPLTTDLICLETSSTPKFSLDIATEMSSFGEGSKVDLAGVFGFSSAARGYCSPARIAFAYSFGSKSGLAKTE
jgi:hypothetical protein